MFKYSVFIVDDEANSISILKHILENYCENVEVKFTANNITDAYNKLLHEMPDILFLDIEMPGGNGFELVSKFEFFPFKVVFTTGFDKYAIQAIKISCLDYLLKPISIKEVQKVFGKLDKTSTQKREKVQNFIKNMNTNIPHHRIGIPVVAGLEFISINNILYLEADGNCTYVFNVDGTKIFSTRTLGNFEQLLENYPFARIHRKHMINLNYLVKYNKGEGGSILLNNGVHLDVSRRKKEAFLSRLNAI